MEDLDEVLDELPRNSCSASAPTGSFAPTARSSRSSSGAACQVECLSTDAAVRRYGELDEHGTAAALHPTC